MRENRNGLGVNTRLTEADGRAECRAALEMVEEVFQRVRLGADKGYDAKEFVRELRNRQVAPHGGQKPVSAIDHCTSSHPGYRLIQRRRKQVEEVFGWLMTGGCCARHAIAAGLARVGSSPLRLRPVTWCECAT